jgi:pilus assembly protein Flp/PilA
MARENPAGKHRQVFFWMRRLLAEFFKNESGATAIEYCIIAAGISIVIVSGVNGIGSALNTEFAAISSSLR